MYILNCILQMDELNQKCKSILNKIFMKYFKHFKQLSVNWLGYSLILSKFGVREFFQFQIHSLISTSWLNQHWLLSLINDYYCFIRNEFNLLPRIKFCIWMIKSFSVKFNLNAILINGAWDLDTTSWLYKEISWMTRLYQHEIRIQNRYHVSLRKAYAMSWNRKFLQLPCLCMWNAKWRTWEFIIIIKLRIFIYFLASPISLSLSLKIFILILF